MIAPIPDCRASVRFFSAYFSISGSGIRYGANQRTDAKLHQAMRLLDRRVICQDFPRFSDDSSRLGLDDVNPPRDVEDRRDSIIPV